MNDSMSSNINTENSEELIFEDNRAKKQYYKLMNLRKRLEEMYSNL